MSTSPPWNYTPNLIPILRRALLKQHEKGQIQRAWLCFPGAVHIAAEGWDIGWGCGYRNFLMACAALMEQQTQPMYFPLLDHPMPPGVRNLQHWIENAWKDGFDEEGAVQLNRKLAGTRKWIGTAELYVAFTSRGVPSHLVDLDLSERDVDVMLQWVFAYFNDDAHRSDTVQDALRGATPVVVTGKMPLILQHQGHSRTIVGCERLRDGSINLLVFDPSKSVPKELRQAALPVGSADKTSHSSNQSLKDRISTSKLFNKITYPRQGKKKREAGDPSPSNRAAKRARTGDIDEVIVIDSDEEISTAQTCKQPAHDKVETEPTKLLKQFRITASQLKKRDKYQILYFPLSDPLTPSERNERRIVTSIKV
ncbi:DUF1671-domain-containing protein [Panus rudis PR-1116 ss-1]|nr:DUF1671-domain-containing protein [Panus rudis PR-1116 ss-1]